MKKLGDLLMILDLHRQGLKVAVIARQVGIDRKTVRKYIARGLGVPTYGPRTPPGTSWGCSFTPVSARLPKIWQR